MSSFRDSLFDGSHDRQIEPVETPMGLVYVRTMTAGEKDDFDINATKDGKFRCRLVMICCCDQGGGQIFSNQDLPRLDQTPTYLLEPIVDAALKINHMGVKDAEEIRKNSESRGRDSSTVWRWPSDLASER